MNKNLRKHYIRIINLIKLIWIYCYKFTTWKKHITYDPTIKYDMHIMSYETVTKMAFSNPTLF